MRGLAISLGFVAGVALLAACGGGGGTNGNIPSGGATSGPTSSSAPTSKPTNVPQSCNGSVASTYTPAPNASPLPAGIQVPPGFQIQVIASLSSPRELAALPNGDLLVGTGYAVMIIPNAESSGAPGAPQAFFRFNNGPTEVSFAQSTCTVFVGTTTNVYAMPYHDGELVGPPSTPSPILAVRVSPTPSGRTDNDGHYTTSVAYSNGQLYVGIGSSCNACVEADPTRATIQVMSPTGGPSTMRAKDVRNPIAMAVNPATGSVWIGGAGQDDLPSEHPYEYMDPVSLEPNGADYGWPNCEENQHAYTAGYNCSNTVEPRVEILAYSTIIGATFYPTNEHGTYAFPAQYAGGLFVSAHGSWHDIHSGATCASPSQVDFVPMNGDTPKTPVNWNDPTAQWTPFVYGLQSPDCIAGDRSGRPTGVAVGSQGSLFLADDKNGLVYRIRPIP